MIILPRNSSRVTVVMLSLMLCIVVTACNLAGDVPDLTPDGDNRIFITSTPILPTPNENGVIVVTATPSGAIGGQPDVVTQSHRGASANQCWRHRRCTYRRTVHR